LKIKFSQYHFEIRIIKKQKSETIPSGSGQLRTIITVFVGTQDGRNGPGGSFCLAELL
jgi:hypothetical protein